jgi:hypothetical protein
MKKDTYWPIIQCIVMAIIATIMYIIFARTKATGNNNLFWIVIFAVFDAIVIIATIIDAINAPAVKQLALSLPYTILFAAQHFLIETEKISEICCHDWWNFSVGFAICVFNIVVYIVDEDLDDDEFSAGIMAVISGIILFCMLCYLLWLFYTFMSSI